MLFDLHESSSDHFICLTFYCWMSFHLYTSSWIKTAQFFTQFHHNQKLTYKIFQIWLFKHHHINMKQKQSHYRLRCHLKFIISQDHVYDHSWLTYENTHSLINQWYDYENQIQTSCIHEYFHHQVKLWWSDLLDE